jgi:hypothetical protein
MGSCSKQQQCNIERHFFWDSFGTHSYEVWQRRQLCYLGYPTGAEYSNEGVIVAVYLMTIVELSDMTLRDIFVLPSQVE